MCLFTPPACAGYSFCLPTEGWLRLSRPGCLVLRQGGLPVQRRSPAQALTWAWRRVAALIETNAGVTAKLRQDQGLILAIKPSYSIKLISMQKLRFHINPFISPPRDSRRCIVAARRYMHSAVYAVVWCLSVRHIRVLFQND